VDTLGLAGVVRGPVICRWLHTPRYANSHWDPHYIAHVPVRKLTRDSAVIACLIIVPVRDYEKRCGWVTDRKTIPSNPHWQVSDNQKATINSRYGVHMTECTQGDTEYLNNYVGSAREIFIYVKNKQPLQLNICKNVAILK
jgi:hypothetical protein